MACPIPPGHGATEGEGKTHGGYVASEIVARSAKVRPELKELVGRRPFPAGDGLRPNTWNLGGALWTLALPDDIHLPD
jgi:hypothetical protein